MESICPTASIDPDSGGSAMVRLNADFEGHCLKMKNTFLHIECKLASDNESEGDCIMCRLGHRRARSHSPRPQALAVSTNDYPRPPHFLKGLPLGASVRECGPSSSSSDSAQPRVFSSDSAQPRAISAPAAPTNTSTAAATSVTLAAADEAAGTTGASSADEAAGASEAGSADEAAGASEAGSADEAAGTSWASSSGVAADLS